MVKLFLLGFVSLFLSDAVQGSPGELELTAVPHNVVNGTTESLKITCRPPVISDDLNYIVLLHLDRADGDVKKPVASERASKTVVYDDDNRTTADGSLFDGAFLTVTINSPGFQDTGLYQCRFAYLNMKTFEVTVLSKELTITFSEPEDPVPPPAPSAGCTCDLVWAEVKKLRETLIIENRELKKQLSAFDDKCRVSFSAKFSNRMGIPFQSKLVARFDTTMSNKGGAYSNETGEFTAPCAGQYSFLLSMRTHQQDDSGYVEGVIEHNGKPMARTSVFTETNQDHYEQATNGVVLTLAEGDKVQVRIQTTSAGQFYGDDWTVFSGFYISP